MTAIGMDDLRKFWEAIEAGERVEVTREVFDYFLDLLPPAFQFRLVTLPDGLVVTAEYGFREGDGATVVFWRPKNLGPDYLAQRLAPEA